MHGSGLAQYPTRKQSQRGNRSNPQTRGAADVFVEIAPATLGKSAPLVASAAAGACSLSIASSADDASKARQATATVRCATANATIRITRQGIGEWSAIARRIERQPADAWSNVLTQQRAGYARGIGSAAPDRSG